MNAAQPASCYSRLQVRISFHEINVMFPHENVTSLAGISNSRMPCVQQEEAYMMPGCCIEASSALERFCFSVIIEDNSFETCLFLTASHVTYSFIKYTCSSPPETEQNTNSFVYSFDIINLTTIIPLTLLTLFISSRYSFLIILTGQSVK